MKNIFLLHQELNKRFIENREILNEFESANKNILLKLFNLKVMGDIEFKRIEELADTIIFNNLNGFELNDLKRDQIAINESFGYNFFSCINKLIQLPAMGKVTNTFSGIFFMFRSKANNTLQFNYGLNFEFKKGGISIKIKDGYLDIHIIFMRMSDDFLSIEFKVDDDFNVIGKSTFITENIMDEDLDLTRDKLLQIMRLIYSANLNNESYQIHEIENLINEIILGEFENVDKYCVLQEMVYI